MKPTKQFLEHIATNPDKLFEHYINKEINRRKKINSVNDYLLITNNSEDDNNNSEDDNNSDDDTDNKKIKNNLVGTKLEYEKTILKESSKFNKSEDRLINKIKSTNIKNSLTINI